MELRLGNIPLRIRGWFFVMAILLGANERDPLKLATWVVVVLVSVVIHELGHALVGKIFGLVPRIELHGMGGTTSFERPPPPPGVVPIHAPLSAARNVAISLAGPFAGFFFALAVFGAGLAGFHPTQPLVVRGIQLLFAVNVYWGIFNLVPMLPLDGGNVLQSILVGIAKEKGDRIARIVSVVVAAAIALLAVQRSEWWLLYLGVLFAFRNVQSLKQGPRPPPDDLLVHAIEAAYRAYDRTAWREVEALLGPLLFGPVPAAASEARTLALRVFIGALFEDGRLPEVMALIAHEKTLIPAEDLERYAGRLREMGRDDDAAKMAALGTGPPVLSEFRA